MLLKPGRLTLVQLRKIYTEQPQIELDASCNAAYRWSRAYGAGAERGQGLALINGTQVSTALALRGLFATEKLFSAAVVAGSMTVEALKGSYVPFDAHIQEVLGQIGQVAATGLYRSRSMVVRSTNLMRHVLEFKIRTRCVASPKSWALALTTFALLRIFSCVRRMRYRTTHLFLPLMATCVQAATSMQNQ